MVTANSQKKWTDNIDLFVLSSSSSTARARSVHIICFRRCSIFIHGDGGWMDDGWDGVGWGGWMNEKREERRERARGVEGGRETCDERGGEE